MSTITEPSPRPLALTEAEVSVWFDQIRRSMVEERELARMVTAAGCDPETLRSHGLAAERVQVAGDPAEAVRSLTARITRILQES